MSYDVKQDEDIWEMFLCAVNEDEIRTEVNRLNTCMLEWEGKL